MREYELYFATNRAHEPPGPRSRLHPRRYGTTFSTQGTENLRFGWLSLRADEKRVRRHLGEESGYGKGHGNALQKYFTGMVRGKGTGPRIETFGEKLNARASDTGRAKVKLGSQAMFGELHQAMGRGGDTLVYIHGFNVDWEDAVGSALALQEMLNRGVGKAEDRLRVVLFTWPSNGHAYPYLSYLSDRTDAVGSGFAFGRGVLRLRDWLARLMEEIRRKRGEEGAREACRRRIHLLCHSMGNYVLESMLRRMWEHTPGAALPRIFDQVFLCAADVGDDALEPGGPLYPIHEMAGGVSVYFNRGDLAMDISDATKGNPDRLGSHGAARPPLLHAKVQQVDCSGVVTGTVEHSYYLDGWVNDDIARTLAGVAPDDLQQRRRARTAQGNTWALRGR